jgi:hypothetical protein
MPEQTNLKDRLRGYNDVFAEPGACSAAPTQRFSSAPSSNRSWPLRTGSSGHGWQQTWRSWRSALILVKPDAFIGWHRKGWPIFGVWKSRPGPHGRPSVATETRELIRKMSRDHSLWGAPRIQGELLKLGIDIGESNASLIPRQSRGL